MKIWAIVPIKAPEQCKTRLRPTLDDHARTTLVAAMLRHVVETTRGASGIDDVAILGPSRHGLPTSTSLLPDYGGGLNAELQLTAQTAAACGVDRLLIIAADLPALTPADVEALTAAPGIAIAPDRDAMGTNALSLPLAWAQDFRFQFGLGSFQAHREEGARFGLPLQIIQTATLGLDIDEAEDLARLPPAFRALI